jgi:hypothetical protein
MENKLFLFGDDTRTAPNQQRTTLEFRFRRVPKEATFKLYLRNLSEIGTQLLKHVSAFLKTRGFEFSEPERTGKAFGPSMECRIGDDVLVLVAVCDEEDRWVLMLGRHDVSNRKQRLYVHDMLNWKELQELLSDALGSVEGVREIRWVSSREAFEAKRQALRSKSS